MNLKERAQKLKTDIPALVLSLKHKDTPIIAKVLAAITVVYALSPIDLIPDFIPVLGYLDDVILLPAFIALTLKLIPNEIFETCKIEANKLLKNPKMKKWYYSIPIICIWLFILVLILKWIFN